jgi:hypothetical protein
MTKTCPFCKSAIPAGATHCRHCTKNVTTVDKIASGFSAIGWVILLTGLIPALIFVSIQILKLI